MPKVAKREIDILQPADYELFRLGAQNMNYITDYYMRTPTSGTRWMRNPLPPDKRKSAGWSALHQAWIKDGSPPKIWEHADIEYEIQWDENNDPIFFHHHGWLALDWQLKIHHSPCPEITCIAGFGSGKTAFEATSACTLAMTTPNARIFCIAPQMIQAMEVYKYICTNFQNTPFWNRFVWNFPQKPIPKFVIRNDYIGESTIEILSVEHDPEKVRTLEGDIVFLDQAEKISELDDLVRDAGSRLRGMVQGRARYGKFIMFANAGDNDELWYRYQMMDEDPETFYSLTVKTWENPYLSESDIKNLKRRVGGTSEDIDQWLGGERPQGAGEHFPAWMVRDCTDQTLEHLMDDAREAVMKAREYEEELTLQGVKFESQLPNMVGYNYVKREAPKVGIFQWELPPDHDSGRKYLVIGDPGQGNPPDRNSPPIMVWDITNFPEKPATLRAFHWVFGNGSYWPFVREYERYVKLYRAQGSNGFDSTGTQTGFDELVFQLQNLMAEGMNLAGNNKYFALNSLKMFMGKRLMVFPHISHLSNQLTNYKLPDNKLKQDLVMCMAMSAMWLRRLYWLDINEEDPEYEPQLSHDRHHRPVLNRHERKIHR